MMGSETAGIQPINASSALFEDVFKTHFKNLHAYACTILKDTAAAEEIVQNVFYKLWEKKNKIAIETSLTAYLYKMVYYESLNFLKHMKVQKGYQKYVADGNTEYEHADSLALKELQQKIDIAINQLPEQCRTIFQLSRFEELKYRAIADKLGISVKTVESQMTKALKTLRVKLVEYLPVLLFIIHIEKWMR